MKFLLLILTTLVAQALARKPAKTTKYQQLHIELAYACEDSLSEVLFGFNSTSYYPKICQYEPHLASVMICFADKTDAYSRTFNKSIYKVMETCDEYGNFSASFDEYIDIYQNGTKYVLDYNNETNYTSTVFYQPTRVDQVQVHDYMKYLDNIYYNFDKPQMFAGIFYCYFIFVFLLFGITNVLQRTGFHTKFNNRVINWYRANVSIPALFNGKHTDSWALIKVCSTLIPTRTEAIVVFFFVCLNVLLGTVHYSAAYTGTDKKYVYMWRIIADRTGLLSFGQIPLLIIFSGRNNIITSLTGIPYTSLIFYHKWTARLMWIHAFVHSVGWTAYGIAIGYLKGYYEEPYWRWGAVATVAGGLLIFQAFHFFRNLSYELFLTIHILLAVFFVIGCWYHCYDLGWLEWIYVSFAVWGFDRLTRIGRMALFGIKNAEIKSVGDDTFRVEVPYNKWFDPFPGSFAYLYFMTPTLFLQSHPFTLLKSVHKENHITFYIKTKAGITKRIMNQLHNQPNGTKTIKVCVEGPYGHRAPTNRYDKALIYTGGNGIPGPFAHLMDLSMRDSASKQEIKFLWVVRNTESLCWFADELRLMAQLTKAKLDIYITGKKKEEKPKEDTKESTSESSDNEKSVSFTTPHEQEAEELIASLSPRITFHYQRPDVEALIHQELTEEHGPSVCVMSCGPPKMVDQIRASVANNLQKSKGRVDLFEELQVW